ncbi:MAG: nucleotide exchange factor GrpE [Actinobacteria bacterium]|nr:nucleotide exchange factor GrpE [Actinomycetota bacterium]
MSNDSTTSNPEGADDATPFASDAPSGEVNSTDAASSDAVSSENGAPLGFDVSDVLAAVTKERDDFKDLALRLQADFENFRKRVTAQVTDDVDRATAKLVESVLPVLDACEAAAAHGVQGIESVWSSLLGALQKQGLEALDLADKPFDPATADAVVHEPSDGSENGPMVVEVLRTGYRWKGRVVRAAMVKVKG